MVIDLCLHQDSTNRENANEDLRQVVRPPFFLDK